jgi:hypothetical protein
MFVVVFHVKIALDWLGLMLTLCKDLKNIAFFLANCYDHNAVEKPKRVIKNRSENVYPLYFHSLPKKQEL